MDVEAMLSTFVVISLAYVFGLGFCSMVFDAVGNKAASRRAIRSALFWIVMAATPYAILASGRPS
jgi:hypothetical protein